ncbi:TetR/AcrR family transcriptional regulator [Desulfosporosinus sp.]|uniref:TetR/AcrR family transcriptional regulator n=1 Tax=Desulfosporosinus sp. TaxID=157907 RepID=UPI0025BFA6D4|nr:TetR/AcrR family transcriptional regulator [Desulfosporosinus sp.]MBC2722238.1 TetR/AcrR family transcriptional regulator [Desulfosporosinus sp.]MBC2725194.1 TetR/AcrR family transcriptional regulator [Desulfosporosinus sp.]
MPIPKLRQNKERRQRLTECAIDLFIEKGYFNTSVREIIVKSGFGTGTFYNYFIDKEDILKALLEEFAEQIISGVSTYYTTEKDLYKRFIETKRVTMEIFAQNEKLSEIYSRVAGTSQTIDNCLKQFEDKLIDFYIRNIEYGINKGAFNNVSVPPIAHAILAVEKFLLFKWIVLKDITKEEMVAMVISFHETLAKGLVNNK